MPVLGELEVAKSQRRAITFCLNGEKQTVPLERNPESSLADYIRYAVGVRGVKIMCQEGGCGACSVAVTKYNYLTEKQETRTIKSCLCPLFAVDGWQITTIEGLGNKKHGFHPIQKRIASFNGSQCGYCTPGFVMNAYGHLNANPKPTQAEIEASLDGNICRCTGYRPILDAMKSFASDSSVEGGGCIDIEDLKFGTRTGNRCDKGEHAGNTRDIATDHPGRIFEYTYGNTTWYKPKYLRDLLELIRDNKEAQVFFGNTGRGIFKDEPRACVQIDLQNVTEFYHCKYDQTTITFGSNLTLNTLIDKMNELKSRPGFSYLGNIVQHLKRVSSNQIRNSGTWAGNLMLKHYHQDFSSDVFIVFEAAGAKLEVADCSMSQTNNCKTLISCEDLIRTVNMQGKVITAVKFHSFDAREVLRTYKVSQRHQLSHAYVNAGFRVIHDPKENRILGKSTIVIGGLNDKQIHMKKTEDTLSGKQLTETNVKDILEVLATELDPVEDIFVKKEYKLRLAVSFLYRFILELSNSNVAKRLKSGAFPIERPLSKGEQTYQNKKEEWPLKEPIVKQESYIQAAGEAQYTDDIPKQQRELQGAFVLSTVANAEIASVDPTGALKMSGVVRYITASDIPEGSPNALAAPPDPFNLTIEQLFITDSVSYSGQRIGLILAENHETARLAASKVKITYRNIQKPVLSIEEAIAAHKLVDMSTLSIKPIIVGNAEGKMKNAKHVVEGIVDQKGAYHFYLENQVCLTIPKESAYEIHVSTQSVMHVHNTVSQLLQLPAKDIHVTTNRIGGAFGGKVEKALPVAAGSALGAYLTERPVRIVVPLSQNMDMSGGRFPFYVKYKVGFDDDGKIEALDADIYLDSGFQLSGIDVVVLWMMTSGGLDGGYQITDANIRLHLALTDTSFNVPMRSPQFYPATLFIESVLEHISYTMKKNPIFVKEKNLIQEGQVSMTGTPLNYCSLPRIWNEMRRKADVDKRMAEVGVFNQENQWKKRAITMTPIKYHMTPVFAKYTASVSIYQRDGTVNISTGGVEMGQGLHTKVSQAAAWKLGIPVEVIRVLPNDSFTNPDNIPTVGSFGSEGSVLSMLNCCQTLKDRIEPIKKKYPDDSWPDLVNKCAENGIDLTCKQTSRGLKDDYYVYGVSVVECELDVLTGESQIQRVDMLYDCGESLNPKIDIGQIEGAFMMGVGHILQESIIRDPNTGRMLSDGTWNYKPPLTRDVPVDWRVHLLTDAPNPVGVKGSKTTGEPSITMAVGVLMALRSAVATAKEDLTGIREYPRVEIPMSVQNVGLQCGVTIDKLTVVENGRRQ